MNDLISYMNNTLGACQCGAVHFPLTIEKIALGEHAVDQELLSLYKSFIISTHRHHLR
ncbi:hypothetical protein QKW52_17055 [Bacillus sonorensis]|nr:hypothetical protein [Bacillus sonorensis]